MTHCAQGENPGDQFNEPLPELPPANFTFLRALCFLALAERRFQSGFLRQMLFLSLKTGALLVLKLLPCVKFSGGQRGWRRRRWFLVDDPILALADRTNSVSATVRHPLFPDLAKLVAPITADGADLILPRSPQVIDGAADGRNADDG
jgi:hypothetical protein